MRFTSLIVELIRARPVLLVWIVALIQAALWLIVPMLVYGGPPEDVALVLAYGREYQVGIDPGPPLAFWLADIAYRMAGGHIIGVYLLTQICTIATYWAVFVLGRATVGAQHAVLAVLLMATVPFFGFPALAFGPDVLAQPLWAVTLASVWRVLGEQRRNAWFMVSISSGLLLLTTPAAVGLLALVVVFALATKRGRQALASFDPLLALAVIFALALPYLVWLWRAGLLNVVTPAMPPWREVALQWGGLLGVLVLACVGIVALMAVANIRGRPMRNDDPPLIMRAPVAPFARQFILTFALIPPVLAALASAWLGHHADYWSGRAGIIGGAGTVLVLAGLAAVVLAKDSIALRRRKTLRVIWGAMVAAPAIAVMVVALFAPWFSQQERAISLPAKAIGHAFGDSFERRTGQPLPAVAGDAQLARLVAMGSSRPHVFLDATPEKTPWQTMAGFLKTGGVVVWRASDTAGAPPPDIAAHFPGLTPEVPRSFDRLINGRLPPLRIGWAIIRPAGP